MADLSKYTLLDRPSPEGYLGPRGQYVCCERGREPGWQNYSHKQCTYSTYTACNFCLSWHRSSIALQLIPLSIALMDRSLWKPPLKREVATVGKKNSNIPSTSPPHFPLMFLSLAYISLPYTLFVNSSSSIGSTWPNHLIELLLQPLRHHTFNVNCFHTQTTSIMHTHMIVLSPSHLLHHVLLSMTTILPIFCFNLKGPESECSVSMIPNQNSKLYHSLVLSCLMWLLLLAGVSCLHSISWVP